MYIGIFEGPLQMYFWGKNKTWLFEIRISLFLITFHSEATVDYLPNSPEQAKTCV